jgi:hypothetical protein
MPRFVAVVRLSPTAHQDLAGSRERFALVQRYLTRRGIAISTTFTLGGTLHLFVLESLESPTRMLNRALAQAWPEPGERPERARVVSADRAAPHRVLIPARRADRVGTPSRSGLAAG